MTQKQDTLKNQPSLSLRVEGAGQEVTGSCHIIESIKDGIRKLLILDCGYFQGGGMSKKEIFRRNYEEIPAITCGKNSNVPISDIDIVLSHAHFDHIGRTLSLIKAAKNIYKNVRIRIFTTINTFKFLKTAFQDSYNIQLKELDKHKNKKSLDSKKIYFYDEQDINKYLKLDNGNNYIKLQNIREDYSKLSTLVNILKRLLKEGETKSVKSIMQKLEIFSLTTINIESNIHLKLEQILNEYNQKKILNYNQISKLKNQITQILNLKYLEELNDVQVIPLEYLEEIKLIENIRIKFYNAGHVIGSASTLLKIPFELLNLPPQKRKKYATFLYTGDLGNNRDLKLDITGEINKPKNVDICMMESTYGNREREDQKNFIKEMTKAIEQTLNNGQNVIVPSFALERAQTFLFYVYDIIKKINAERKEQKQKPIKIYIDSKLCIEFTKIIFDIIADDIIKKIKKNKSISYKQANDVLLKELDIFTSNFIAFQQMPMQQNNKTKHKKHILKIQEKHFKNIHEDSPCIIISSSGMGDFGASKGHISFGLQNKKTLILLIGYMAKGTLGRKLVDTLSPNPDLHYITNEIRKNPNIFTKKTKRLKINDNLYNLKKETIQQKTIYSINQIDQENNLIASYFYEINKKHIIQGIKINKETFLPINATIKHTKAFSSHADKKDLISYIRNVNAKISILVHGEKNAMFDLKDELSKNKTIKQILCPQTGDMINLEELFENIYQYHI